MGKNPKYYNGVIIRSDKSKHVGYAVEAKLKSNCHNVVARDDSVIKTRFLGMFCIGALFVRTYCFISALDPSGCGAHHTLPFSTLDFPCVP